MTNANVENTSFKEVSEEKIAEAKAIGNEIQIAIEKMQQQSTSQNSFADIISSNITDKIQSQDIQSLEAQGAEFCTLKPAEAGLMTSKVGCALCTTGLYVGIAALIGGAVVLTGGMSIAAVAAASGYSMAGLSVVISAMTGISTGAVTAIIGAGQVSLGIVVLGLCEAMGKC